MIEPRRWLALALPLAVAGCATPKFLCVNPSGVHDVAITSLPETNGGRPVAVDLVFVTQKPAAAVVAKLKAAQYFDLRDQLLRDFPAGLRVWRRELQAGQYVAAGTGPQPKPPCNLVQTLVFASYGGDGDHRVVLGKAKKINVLLGTDDLTVSAR